MAVGVGEDESDAALRCGAGAGDGNVRHGCGSNVHQRESGVEKHPHQQDQASDGEEKEDTPLHGAAVEHQLSADEWKLLLRRRRLRVAVQLVEVDCIPARPDGRSGGGSHGWINWGERGCVKVGGGERRRYKEREAERGR